MQTQIRQAGLDDLDAAARLFDLYRQFYEQAPDLDGARAFLEQRFHRRDSIVLLAYTEIGQIRGFCQLYPSFCSILAKPIYVLSDLYVEPAARGQGLGTALMQAARRKAIEAGVARLDLTTAKDNLTAQALYAAHGWTRDEVYYAYNLVV